MYSNKDNVLCCCLNHIYCAIWNIISCNNFDVVNVLDHGCYLQELPPYINVSLVLGMAKPHHVSEPIMFILEPYFQCFCLCTLKFPVIVNIWCKLFLDPIGPMIPGDWVLMQLAHAQNSPLVDKTSHA